MWSLTKSFQKSYTVTNTDRKREIAIEKTYAVHL